MREVLSNMITNSAVSNEDFVLMTGDHGYALFDEMRKAKSEKFINVGIMEQALISMAAGMCKVGYKPLCYGLAAFLPIRVLEQIKFDICLPKLPVKMIGDGAGLVYSFLGNSHQCAEDIASLMPLPHVEIYSPGDPEEMRICYQEFISSENPAYLRVGKSDNPRVNLETLNSISPYFTRKSENKTCIVSSGAMLGEGYNLAEEFDLSHLSIMKLKPIHKEVVELLSVYETIFVIEEHARKGGLTSSITDLFIDERKQLPIVYPFTLNSSFTAKAGSYQYALSEHNMSSAQLRSRLKSLL
jgi:transketolase